MGRKSRPNLALFHACKIRRGVSETSESKFQVHAIEPDLTSDILLDLVRGRCAAGRFDIFLARFSGDNLLPSNSQMGKDTAYHWRSLPRVGPGQVSK